MCIGDERNRPRVVDDVQDIIPVHANHNRYGANSNIRWESVVDPESSEVDGYRRSGSTSPKGQSNTTILTLSSPIYWKGRGRCLCPSPGSKFLIAQKSSMVTTATQPECPAQWETNDIPVSSCQRALTCIAS